jgi:hypothetical protein
VGVRTVYKASVLQKWSKPPASTARWLFAVGHSRLRQILAQGVKSWYTWGVGVSDLIYIVGLLGAVALVLLQEDYNGFGIKRIENKKSVPFSIRCSVGRG